MADCLAPGLTKTCSSNWPLLCARTQLDDEALVVEVDEDARTVNATVGERQMDVTMLLRRRMGGPGLMSRRAATNGLSHRWASLMMACACCCTNMQWAVMNARVSDGRLILKS